MQCYEDEEVESFYEEEDESKINIEGISGDVTSFTYTNLCYPCIIFKEGFNCPKHQLTVISNMVKSKSSDKDINLYFIQDGELFRMGSISGLQVDAFLQIVGLGSVYGYYDAETKLENDRLYTLCTIL